MKLFLNLVREWWRYQPAWVRLPVLPLTLFVAALAAADEALTNHENRD